MRFSIYRVLEVAIGCCLAVWAAMALGLVNSVSAGIITILSIQDTKKETLRSAVERFAAFVLAVVTAYASFALLGYTVLSLGAYLLVFVALAYAFGLQASIPICTVLVSHFWLAGHMQLWLIGNEALLMLIGTGIGVGSNLLLPRDVGAIQAAQAHIEDILRRLFDDIAAVLDGTAGDEAVKTDMLTLRAALRGAREQAAKLEGNTLGSDAQYYGLYVEMRRHQYTILRRIEALLAALDERPVQAGVLAAYMRGIAGALHEGNDAQDLLAALDTMREEFRGSALPVTRDAFETRATLYNILIDTEHFLLVKKAFVEGLPEEQRRVFQPGREGEAA